MIAGRSIPIRQGVLDFMFKPRVTFAVLLLAAGAALAQKPTPPPPPQEGVDQGLFFETVSVNVVNVDVYVTDRAGNRVRGLTKDDFELFEERKPVQITNFYSVDSGKPSVELPPAAPEPLVPGAPPVSTQPEIPDEQQLFLVIYVDNFNIRQFNRNRVFRDIRQFLVRNLHRGDQVMLVTYDRELHVRHTFTSDPQVIASALFDIEKISSFGGSADNDRREVLEAIEEAQDGASASARVRSYADSLYNDVNFTISALKEFVGSIAGLPGRKAILYVSDGVPMRAGEDMYYKLQEKFPDQSSLLDAMTFDNTRAFQEVAAAANANRVTFYTLEATGLRVATSVSAENRSASSSGIVDSVYFSNLQAPLQQLARETGGQAMLNMNVALPALERVASDFDTYYSLGYTPTHAGDGRYYKLDVKVKGKKGLTVRHRDGYRDKTTESRMADATMASLFFGFEKNPLAVGLEFGDVSRRDDGNFTVPLRIKIPIGKLALVPKEGGQQARARAFIAVMDSKGGTSPVQEASIPIDIPEDQVKTATQQYYSYTVTLIMRPGEQRVAVAVRDEFAASSSFVRRTVTVGG
jgi:VWFA-related protein